MGLDLCGELVARVLAGVGHRAVDVGECGVDLGVGLGVVQVAGRLAEPLTVITGAVGG